VNNARRNELQIASVLLHKVADGIELSPGDSLQAMVAVSAVDAILKPGGWTQLREDEGVFTTNLPLTTRKSLRDALKKAAERKRESLTGVVTQGFGEVLAGTWTPPERGKSSPMAAGDSRAVLNVTIEDALRKKIQRALPRLSEELGYKVTEGGIAMSYLLKELEPELAKLLPESSPRPE
jgi:hypothetical protein